MRATGIALNVIRPPQFLTLLRDAVERTRGYRAVSEILLSSETKHKSSRNGTWYMTSIMRAVSLGGGPPGSQIEVMYTILVG